MGCTLGYFGRWCLHMLHSPALSNSTLNALRWDTSLLLPASKQQQVPFPAPFALRVRSLRNCPANECLLKLGWLRDFFCAIMSEACQGEKKNTCNFQARTKLSNSGLNNNEKKRQITKRKLATITITASAAVHTMFSAREKENVPKSRALVRGTDLKSRLYLATEVLRV